MRKNLVSASLIAFLLVQSPAVAQTNVADDVVARIEAEGYVVTDVRRSWLGRTVITAVNENDLREVVLNRTSGEVLRDQRFANESVDTKTPATSPTPPNGPAAPQGPGQPGDPAGPGNGGGPGNGSGGPGGPGGKG